MVVMQILIYFGPLTLILQYPLTLNLKLAHQIVNDGMTLTQIQIIIWIVDSWYFFRRINFRVILAQVLDRMVVTSSFAILIYWMSMGMLLRRQKARTVLEGCEM